MIRFHGKQRADAEILDPVMSELAFDTSNDTQAKEILI